MPELTNAVKIRKNLSSVVVLIIFNKTDKTDCTNCEEYQS